MTSLEQQQEELECLQSIYEGDPQYNEVSETSFQYKFGDDMHHKSFVLQIDWTPNYPEELPEVHLNAFYNKHLIESVKTNIVEKVLVEADNMLGCGMTFSLFEYVKSNVEEFTMDQPAHPTRNEERANKSQKAAAIAAATTTAAAVATSAPQGIDTSSMSKNQKRKLYNRMGNMASHELIRGWNWVDIVKHLSQVGRGEEQGERPAN